MASLAEWKRLRGSSALRELLAEGKADEESAFNALNLGDPLFGQKAAAVKGARGVIDRLAMRLEEIIVRMEAAERGDAPEDEEQEDEP